MTRFQLLIAVAVGQAIFLTYVGVSSALVEGENKATGSVLGDVNYPMTLQFIGVADGKSYFAEVNQTMNRTAAAAYCHASRLKLASIDTQAQVDMLNKALPEFGFASHEYWTSAKETRKDSMFMWNETEAQVNSSLVSRWLFTSSEYNCIVFYAHNTSSYFRAYPCTTGLTHPLCHT